MAGSRRDQRIGPGVVKRSRGVRVRTSTKALVAFWLTPTSVPMPTWPPFCPKDPEEKDTAPRDACANFAK